MREGMKRVFALAAPVAFLSLSLFSCSEETFAPPPPPTGITATAGNGRVNIAWTAVPGAKSYNIYWSTTAGVTPANGTKMAGMVSPYDMTGLNNGTTYYFVVTAVNANGESVASSQVSATPVFVPPPAHTAKLTVQKGGMGTGTVSGSGISCGKDCEEIFTEGTVVVLTASAYNGSSFVGWSSCDSINGNSCTMTMNGGKIAAADFRWNTSRIELVSERDHIEGSMLGSKAVYADAACIYLATYQGKLFVLARDRSANFPLREVIQDTSSPLTAVRGDETNLYVTSADGNLRVYRKGPFLLLDNTITLSSFGLSSLALTDKKIYVARGSAYLSVDEDHVFLSATNEGEIVLEVDKKTLTPGLTYGQTFEPNTTVVFDRKSGNRISGIANPPNIYGQVGTTDLYVDQIGLAQTMPGPAGPGIYIYNPRTFSPGKTIARTYTNTVAQRDNWLIAGNEGGQVDVFDLGQTPSPLVSSADLRRLTGHAGIEDIEIRALWMDNHDNLIFAGSSWGNDQSRGPSLPSFFVLELRQN